jgi:hypothetical protein
MNEDPVFKEAYEQARRTLREDLEDTISSIVPEAISTLLEILRTGGPAHKLKAISIVLDKEAKLQTRALAEQLATIEASIQSLVDAES